MSYNADHHGIDQVSTIHLGKTSSEMQKKAIDNSRSEKQQQRKEESKLTKAFKNKYYEDEMEF